MVRHGQSEKGAHRFLEGFRPPIQPGAMAPDIFIAIDPPNERQLHGAPGLGKKSSPRRLQGFGIPRRAAENVQKISPGKIWFHRFVCLRVPIMCPAIIKFPDLMGVNYNRLKLDIKPHKRDAYQATA
jgi:hypothetical protein